MKQALESHINHVYTDVHHDPCYFVLELQENAILTTVLRLDQEIETCLWMLHRFETFALMQSKMFKKAPYNQ